MKAGESWAACVLWIDDKPGGLIVNLLTARWLQHKKTSWCEWKGLAQYFDVILEHRRIKDAAWGYPSPAAAFESIRDHVAFYPE